MSRDGGESWRTWTTANGLGDNYVLSVSVDDDTVWVCTGGGLSVSRDGGESWRTWTTANGLGDNYVLSVWVDGDTVWVVAEGGGLTRYRIKDSAQWMRLEPTSAGEVGTVDNRGQITTIRQGPPQIGDTIKLLDTQVLSLQLLGGSFMKPVDDLTYFYQLTHYDEEQRQTTIGTGIGSSGDYVGLAYDTPYEFQLEVVDGEGRRSGVQRWPVLVQTSPNLELSDIQISEAVTQTPLTQVDNIVQFEAQLGRDVDEIQLVLQPSVKDEDAPNGQQVQYEITWQGSLQTIQPSSPLSFANSPLIAPISLLHIAEPTGPSRRLMPIISKDGITVTLPITAVAGLHRLRVNVVDENGNCDCPKPLHCSALPRRLASAHY